MKGRNPPKFLLSFLTINQGMWRSFLSSISLLKRGRRTRRGVKGERKLYLPLSIIVFADESELDDYHMPVTYSSDHDWEKYTTFDIENLLATNSENDDVTNCCTISTIHVPSNEDMFTNEHTLEDSYSIAYYDIIPPIYDDCNDE
jgi:hypothetical protein